MKKKILTLLLATVVMGSNSIPALAEWKKDNTGWWYSIGNSWATGWKFINNNWYYFDYHGYMKTGWVQDTNGKWYYLDQSGKMLSNIITPDGYTLNPDGSWNPSIPKQAVFTTATSGVTPTNKENSTNQTSISNNEQKDTNTTNDSKSDSSSKSSKKKKHHSSSSSSSSNNNTSNSSSSNNNTSSNNSSSTNTTTDDSVKIDTTTDDSVKISRKPSDEALEKAENYSWFKENGNEYFKIKGNKYAKGWLCIDLGVYYFDENGVSQTEPFKVNGVKYYPEDGYYGHYYNQIIENAPNINTAIATGKFKNEYDPIQYKAPDDPTVIIYDYEQSLENINNEYCLYNKDTNTITIKEGKKCIIPFEFRSPTEKYQAPALSVKCESENYNIADIDINLGFLDGYVNMVCTSVKANETGETEITLTVNNFEQTFNIVVEE